MKKRGERKRVGEEKKRRRKRLALLCFIKDFQIMNEIINKIAIQIMYKMFNKNNII